MTVSKWTSIKSWASLKIRKRPVREMPRERCVHSAGCYLCPRSRCVGSLNDSDDPDLTKPRSSSSGHCIFVQGKNGVVRFRVPKAEANARRAREAAELRKKTPPHLWKTPGYDEEEVRAIAKLFDR